MIPINYLCEPPARPKHGTLLSLVFLKPKQQIRGASLTRRPTAAVRTSRKTFPSPPRHLRNTSRTDSSDVRIDSRRLTSDSVHPVLVAPGVVELLPFAAAGHGRRGVAGTKTQGRRKGYDMPLSQERRRVTELRRTGAVLNRHRGLHGAPSHLVRTLSGRAVDPAQLRCNNRRARRRKTECCQYLFPPGSRQFSTCFSCCRSPSGSSILCVGLTGATIGSAGVTGDRFLASFEGKCEPQELVPRRTG